MKNTSKNKASDRIRTEERLHLACDIARLGVWDMDLETGEVIRNAYDANLFGLAPEGYEPTKEAFLALVHPEDRPRVERAIEETLAGFEVVSCEYRIVAPDGSIHWLFTEGKTYRNEEGQPKRMIGVTQDITSRKNMQVELHASEFNLRRLQEIAHLGSYVLDAVKSEKDWWSEETYHIYGLSPLDPPVPHNDFLVRVVHPEDRQRVAEAFVRSVDENTMLDVEARILRPDETVRWVHFLAEPVCNDHGHVVRLQGTVQDVTERRQAEEEIFNSQKRTKAILNTTADAIITIGENGCIQSFNLAAEAIFGYRLDEVIGQNVSMLMTREDSEHHDQYIRNYIESGQAKIIGIGREVTGKRKDGTVFPMELAVSEVQLGRQRIFTGVVHDITQRRELEQQIIQISEYERQRIGQELHDALGSQLTGIGLICSHLVRQTKEKDPALAEELALVTAQVKEADHMARNIARGLVPVASEPAGLLQALSRLVDIASRFYGIECMFEGDETALIDNYLTSTNLYRIAQEALNNAVKHGKATNVKIRLKSIEPTAIELSIEDNGKGFPDVLPIDRGIGVRTMHYRANLIGGNLTIKAVPDSGTHVICHLQGVENGEVAE